MKLTYEDSCFYKVLLCQGFTKEVDEWINEIIRSLNDNEVLQGVYLDLVCAYNLKENSLNEMISCLHNYIGDNKLNEEEVCNKLRLFIKDKYDKGELNELDAVNYLAGFAISSEKQYDKYWINLFELSYITDYYDEDFLEEDEYKEIIKVFLETGKTLDVNPFWNRRAKRERKRMKREALFICLIIIGILLIIYLIAYIISNKQFVTYCL